VLVELNYVSVFFYAIKDNCNRDGQITYLFALGDLLDVDDSGNALLLSLIGPGVLGEEFIKLGIIEEIIRVLRGVEPSSEFELQLVAAGICALASLCLYDIGRLFCTLFFDPADTITKLMDHREVKLLGHLLQVKHMAHLHSRIVTFISNIYVTGKFQTLLSVYVLPAVMELLIYNITTYKPKSDEQTRSGEEYSEGLEKEPDVAESDTHSSSGYFK
jgi:hypothetical protein